MRLHDKHPDIIRHSHDVWGLLHHTTRKIGKSHYGVTMLEIVTGNTITSGRRFLNLRERELLAEKMLERFEHTFFYDGQMALEFKK